MRKKKKTVCSAKKANGAECSAPALPGGDYCFFHDPDRAAERKAAQSLGGSRNRMTVLGDDAGDVTVKDCEDVVRLIAETINQVRKGEIDPRVANAVGYLANVAIRALDQGELERRLAEIESALKTPRRDSALEQHFTEEIYDKEPVAEN